MVRGARSWFKPAATGRALAGYHAMPMLAGSHFALTGLFRARWRTRVWPVTA